MRRALIVANGELPTVELVRELADGAALIVGADGGGDKALAAGVEPGVVVGDLDSLSAVVRARLGPDRCIHIEDPNTTDLEKAVRHCLALGISRIDIVAAGGGRADHALGNLSVLARYAGVAEIHLHDDQFDISRVNRRSEIDAEPGTVISIVAMGECTGVTTVGLRWDLANARLPFSPYGIHNEVRIRPASVSVANGDLLLFLGRWVEKHR